MPDCYSVRYPRTVLVALLIEDLVQTECGTFLMGNPSLNVVIARIYYGTDIAGDGDALRDGSSPRRGLDIDGDERMQLARKLLLTTEWIVEAGQKHGQVWKNGKTKQGGGRDLVRWLAGGRENGRIPLYESALQLYSRYSTCTCMHDHAPS